MLTVEEEAFTLHILDSIEYLGAENRLLKIIKGLINDSLEDLNSILKKLRSYTKEIRRNLKQEADSSQNTLYNNQVFEKIISELYQIGQLLKWEENFLGILKYYLNSRNLPLSINFLSTYNDLFEGLMKLEGKISSTDLKNKLRLPIY